ncbi:MAG TPA: hypothetical protein VFS21_24630 [Roseiflexaceae bacterium]|nr:hypothetical protein [Roseiflexaceae bacterium]
MNLLVATLASATASAAQPGCGAPERAGCRLTAHQPATNACRYTTGNRDRTPFVADRRRHPPPSPPPPR